MPHVTRIREIQMNATMEYYFLASRMAVIKMMDE
jgi:hypothetical protein